MDCGQKAVGYGQALWHVMMKAKCKCAFMRLAHFAMILFHDFIPYVPIVDRSVLLDFFPLPLYAACVRESDFSITITR